MMKDESVREGHKDTKEKEEDKVEEGYHNNEDPIRRRLVVVGEERGGAADCLPTHSRCLMHGDGCCSCAPCLSLPVSFHHPEPSDALSSSSSSLLSPLSLFSLLSHCTSFSLCPSCEAFVRKEGERDGQQQQHQHESHTCKFLMLHP